MAEEEQTPMDSITEIARKVILTMARYKVPMSPENYRVWFEYTVGSNQQLHREVNSYLRDGAKFTPKLNEQIHEKYFGQNTQKVALEQISKEASKLITDSLDQVVSAGDATQEYSTRLNGYRSRLETKGADPEAFKGMIQDLILDTKKVEETNTEIRQQLEKAKGESEKLRQRLNKAEREVTLDVLTGLYNRKHAEERLKEFFKTYQEEKLPFSVIMMDIDRFKFINDNYGHKIGDAVLQFFGHTIKGAVKGKDLPSRYGGDEFLIALPGTPCDTAVIVTENIRRELATNTLRIKKSQKKIGNVNVSAGVAEIREDDTIESLLERADKALYLAKARGRNNVKSEKHLPSAKSVVRSSQDEAAPPVFDQLKDR